MPSTEETTGSDAARPGKTPASRALAVVAGLLGFTLAVAWIQTLDTERALTPERARLAALVSARQAQAAGLESRLAELRAQLARASSGAGRAAALRRDTDALAVMAGRSALEGPGVVVELRDGDLAGSAEPNASDYRIQDIDLQLVVNALWEAGAEAVAVNGERLVSTTAIRSAGTTILVNFRVLSSPYKVVALGDGGALQRGFKGSQIAERLSRWAEIYGLGVKVSGHSKLAVPAYGGTLLFRYATVASPSPSSSPSSAP